MNRRKFALYLGKSILAIHFLPRLIPYSTKSKKDFLMGKSKLSQFTKLGDHYLENETAAQFQLMKKAARKDGIQIQLISAFRSFTRQKEIFEAKFLKLQQTNLSEMETIRQITQYSSIPGTSRHHWGTDIDLIEKRSTNHKVEDVLQPKHFKKEGIFSNLHLWMQENAASFGFYLTYTNNQERTGYEYEPWHYSYIPKAKVYLQEYLELNMAKKLNSEKIKGLENMDFNFFEKYISDYVEGINSSLR